jgi:hypothetical protein
MAPVDEGPSLAPSWMRKPANRPGTGELVLLHAWSSLSITNCKIGQRCGARLSGQGVLITRECFLKTVCLFHLCTSPTPTGQQAAEQTSKPAFSQVGQESYQPARPSRPRTYSAGPEPPSVTRSASLYPPKSTSPFTSPRYQSSYGDPQPSYSDSRPNRTLSLQPEMPRQAPNRLGSKVGCHAVQDQRAG